MNIVVASQGGLDGKAAGHFAHCSHFVIFGIDDGKVKDAKAVENPYSGRHAPGAIPEFVKSLEADVLMTGGIGPMAAGLLKKMGIEVITGVEGDIRELVERYLKGRLKPEENLCDH